MKLWKRWTAAVLAAAMTLLLLAACGPSGPSAPDAPDKPGSSETGTDPGTGEPGKDPADEKTEAQKVAAVVEALNTVRLPGCVLVQKVGRQDRGSERRTQQCTGQE